MTPDRWREIENLYAQALKQNQDERPAFLEAACGGDDALRREVGALLNVRVDEFKTGEAVYPAIGHLSGGAHASFTGKEIGSYRIISLVGAGGMGEVYRARDIRLGRDVAIKILPPGFTSDPNQLKRFEREARMLAAMNHPNIGAIYGVEELEGSPGLVLEFIDGPTLADILDNEPLPISKVVQNRPADRCRA